MLSIMIKFLKKLGFFWEDATGRDKGGAQITILCVTSRLNDPLMRFIQINKYHI